MKEIMETKIRPRDIKKIVSFLFEAGSLRKTIRSHQQTLLAFDLSDTIASHSFRVTLIGYFLVKALKADENKVLKMCLIHDLEEARSSDHNWVHKKYVKVFEDEIKRDQFGNTPFANELLTLACEYNKRKTIESIITKDADLLDQIFLLREYEWQGNKETQEWLRGAKSFKKQSRQEKLMKTPLAKAIAKEIKKQSPGFWWRESWSSQRRN